MNDIYIAKDDEQLDAICFKFYGSIETEIYAEFLRENEHLLTRPIKGGDVVKLPNIPKPDKKVSYLWE
ncbi:MULTISPECIES: tail protein X [unclassified Campylobacter]|uniref:tail protein X n=1 Tax=unclassified Campylobacter TaxID=2593542 RepID=UPI003D32D05F